MQPNQRAAAFLACVSLLLLAAHRGHPGGDPPPFPASGLHVLVTYDAMAKNQLPVGQRSLVDSVSFRSHLDQACAPDGWRIVPSSAVFNADQPVWQQAMAVPRTSANWLEVSNGKSGKSVELPADEKAATDIVDKYAP